MLKTYILKRVKQLQIYTKKITIRQILDNSKIKKNKQVNKVAKNANVAKKVQIV